MSLKFDIDLNEVSKKFKELNDNVVKDLTYAVGSLATMTHGKLLELTSKISPHQQQQYRDAVHFEKISDGLWVVSLDESAMHIEDGVKPYSMYDTHLKSPKAKTSKEGNKYLTIPFKHNKNPSQQSANARQITNLVKEELGKRNIPYNNIELSANGSPRIGKLHSFNIDSPKVGKGKDPVLKGLTIYQTKQPDGSVRRDIMTFRVISEKFKGDGRWQHPGSKGMMLMDEALAWAESTWESSILPEIMKKYE